MIRVHLGSVCRQAACTIIWKATAVLLHGIHQTQTGTTEQVVCGRKIPQIYSSRLRVAVTTTMVRSAALGPAATTGRLRPTAVAAVAAFTSIRAVGAWPTATVLTASPCGLSSQNNYKVTSFMTQAKVWPFKGQTFQNTA